ncbi:MAG: N-acetyltransferase [Clostridia bacterium]|nr:N-acetyltransferase [Clostridia bacterium]
MSIYDSSPVLTNDRFRLEFSDLNHCRDLLKVYSDKKSVPLFNSDNCGGDDFYYTTYERMKKAIEYWQWEYSRKGFVRMSIIDIASSEAVGTVEMFKRIANDYFNNTVLLRLDLRSDYENKSDIIDIITLVIDSCFDMFPCNSISTKAISSASERIEALRELKFIKSDEYLIGHDGTKYSDYYIYFNQ